MSRNISVFGIYSSRQEVEEGMRSLEADGFRPADISVLYPDNPGAKELSHEKNSKAPEGAAAGIGAGAIVGGALGWLAGIGALAIPELGPLAAAGPIMGALAGAGAAGTVGGVAGALIGFTAPEYEARRYEGRIKTGGILMSVHCDDSAWAKRAVTTLKDTGAQGIARAAEAKADFGASDRPKHRVHGPSRMAS